MAYDKQFMDMAIELAKGCALQDEVPVGCVVVKDGKVVGASGNRKERENNAICHAEILALSEATKAVGNWWLENCDVYVTLEPCVMCAGALGWSQIERVVYGAADDKRGFRRFAPDALHPKTLVTEGVLEAECRTIMQQFFKSRR